MIGILNGRIISILEHRLDTADDVEPEIKRNHDTRRIICSQSDEETPRKACSVGEIRNRGNSQELVDSDTQDSQDSAVARRQMDKSLLTTNCIFMILVTLCFTHREREQDF